MHCMTPSTPFIHWQVKQKSGNSIPLMELLENTFRIRTDGVPGLDARLDALLAAGKNSRL